MDGIFYLPLTFTLPLLWIRGVLGEYCYNSYYGETYECELGCCGNDFDRECCSTNAGIIIGATIGGTLFICGVIFIVCFCLQYKKSKQCRSVGNNPNSSLVFHTAGHQQHRYHGNQTVYHGAQSHQQPFPAQPVQPPSYYPSGASSYPPSGPPAYTNPQGVPPNMYSDPVYPTPSAPPPSYSSLGTYPTQQQNT